MRYSVGEMCMLLFDLQANVQEVYGPSAFRGARQPASVRCNGNDQSRIKMLGRVRESRLELLQCVLLEGAGLKQNKIVQDREREVVTVVMLVMDGGKRMILMMLVMAELRQRKARHSQKLNL